MKMKKYRIKNTCSCGHIFFDIEIEVEDYNAASMRWNMESTKHMDEVGAHYGLPFANILGNCPMYAKSMNQQSIKEVL